jgi:hypothetical protein
MAQDLSSKKLNFASRMQSAIEAIDIARSQLRSLKTEATDNSWSQASFDQTLFDGTALKHITPAMLVAGIAVADALDGTGTGALSAAHRQTIAQFRG